MKIRIFYNSLFIACFIFITFTNSIASEVEARQNDKITAALDESIVPTDGANNASDDLLSVNQSSSLISALALAPPDDGGTEPDSGSGPSNEFIFSRIPVDFALESSTTQLLGDNIDLNNGNVSFNNTDLIAKGNGPTIVVSRKLQGSAFSPFKQANFGDWSLDIPSIQTTLLRSTTRYSGSWGLGKACSGSIAPGPIYNRGVDYGEHEYWNGDKLVLPGGQVENLLENSNSYLVSNSDFKRVTKSNWKFSCISVSGVGEGFKGYSPDGFIYTFSKYRLIPGDLVGNTQRFNAFMLVTKIEDRFGNYVNYNYEGNNLNSITGSDGRTVTFTYGTSDEANFIKSMSYNGRVWSYTYSSASLTKVTRPDGKSWRYNIANYVNTKMLAWNGANCTMSNPFVADFSGTITHPDGVTGTFVFSGQLHGRSNVTKTRIQVNRDEYFTCHEYVNYALKSKRLSGPGLPDYQWEYDYSGNNGTWSTTTPTSSHLLTGNIPSSVDTENHKSTTVTAPDGSKIVYFYNRDFSSYLDGSLIAQDRYDTDGTTLLSREEYSFSKGGALGFTGTMFENNQPSVSRINSSQTTISMGGDIYSVSSSGYDKYGLPLQTTESNNFNSNKRYTKNYYYHDTTNWLIGLPSRTLISSNGTSYKEVSKTTYHSSTGSYKSLPNYQYSYGRWVKRNESYHTTGTQKGLPKLIRHNASNRWIEYSNYKRGIPQTIRTPQSLSTSSQYAYRTVDNNGWITKKTDFLGECISYSHNEIGRIELVNPCNSAWLDTSITYTTTTSNEGISFLTAGMFKQTVSKGNYEKKTYYDGLLRPIFSLERDINISSTKRYTRQSYDSLNRITYQSKPSSSSSTSAGINYSYDGLGRPLIVDDNSTSGSVSYSYLAGNKTSVNDKRGNVTTTSYLSYGSPNTTNAINISSPHNVTTSINYNIYGNVTSISQGGLTEYRIYDTYQNLCKSVRNDVGRTSYNFNEIGKLSWSASGASVSTSVTSCDNSVATAEKTTFTYDNLGNIRKVSYGDGTDDKVYTYDKNSNLTSLEYGDVIQNYTYNDLNLVESERLRIDGFDWTISYLYDNHGNRKNVVYPGGGSLWYQPNALGQPQRVGVFATSISFHPNGLYKSVTLKNGCVNTQTLHTSGYPNIQRSLCGTSNIVYNQYSYDGNGNITFWDDKQSNTYDLRLTYDGLDRLDNIRNGNNSLIGDLNYDSLGNIEKFDSIAGTINYTYDANERLYSTSGMRAYTFTYDDRGNVEDNGFDSFTYNLANEMRSASGNSYVYDGHGKRVKAVDSEGTRYSMYSLSGQLLYERINGAYRQNYYLGSQLIAHQGAGEQTFIHPTF